MAGQLEWFYEHIYANNDPRTSEWFLISRPVSLIMILVLYVYFCVSAGPRYMRNKAPYKLRTTLIVYNFLQVLLSIYLFYEGLMAGWLYEYSWTCQPIDYSESPLAMRMAQGVHLYFVSKITELLDTVFFVLRKKDRQISFLHLYHHVTMPLGSWIMVRYFAGGHVTLGGLLNCFVHIVMYTYYMLAAFGPEIQKYLWWKKYLTVLQIVQFLIVGLHSAQTLFTDCSFPKPLAWLVIVESIVFFYMFGSFYINNHIKKNTGDVKIDAASTNSRKSRKFD